MLGVRPSSYCVPMPRSRQRKPSPPQVQDDLAFPVSYRELAKYLELADRFLLLDQRRNGGSNVVQIDKVCFVKNEKWKKAS